MKEFSIVCYCCIKPPFTGNCLKFFKNWYAKTIIQNLVTPTYSGALGIANKFSTTMDFKLFLTLLFIIYLKYLFSNFYYFYPKQNLRLPVLSTIKFWIKIVFYLLILVWRNYKYAFEPVNYVYNVIVVQTEVRFHEETK